jgi:hypothetical protein
MFYSSLKKIIIMKPYVFIFSKTIHCSFAVFLMICLPVTLTSQVNVTLDTSRMAYNQISSSLKLYVFPTKNQSHNRQKADEFECYKWASQQSGIDPLNMPEVKPESVQSGPDGKVVGGAARGALVGLAIGSIAGDAGKGAAIGAVSGSAVGIRQKRVTQARREEQSKSNAAQKEQDIANSFKKAFSACIEGKGYTIK